MSGFIVVFCIKTDNLYLTKLQVCQASEQYFQELKEI